MPPIYSGGPNVGDNVFYVDGDFRFTQPCGPPRISHPFVGDSASGGRQVVHLAPDAGSPLGYNWFPVPLGVAPNIQSVAINQTNFIIEQDFVVAAGWYVPLPLNTPYDPSLSAGWNLGGDNPFQNLARAVLVSEGPLEDIGAGLVRFRRVYSTVPNIRNVFEQFTYNFIGYAPTFFTSAASQWGSLSDGRPRFPFAVKSRLQFDYFIIDPGALSGYVEAVNSVDEIQLLLAQAYLYINGFQGVDVLFDESQAPESGDFAGAGITLPSPNQTTPSLTQYLDWVDNGYELVAEASVLRPWLGNIYERITRFVVAQ